MTENTPADIIAIEHRLGAGDLLPPAPLFIVLTANLTA
jgi:hypothetical protein